jgi:hypothetical protein
MTDSTATANVEIHVRGDGLGGVDRSWAHRAEIAYVFYESGLSINVMCTVDDPKKRAVGFKLSDGMEVPAELASQFKFARQRSKLAGTIRGSYFNLKNEYWPGHRRVLPFELRRDGQDVLAPARWAGRGRPAAGSCDVDAAFMQLTR